MTAEFDVEFIERGDRSSRFLVRGLSPAFANGIRRAMVADVPTFSMDTVRFVENTSVMFDEMIALRLGLIPLTTPLDDFEIGESVTVALDVEGPATVYSRDIESADDLVVPADENVPIIELKEGQRLEFEADAVLDRGKEHAKHQGGVSVGYRHLQQVTLGDDLGEFDEQDSRILRGVIETPDGEIVPTSEFDHDLTERYPGREIEVTDVPGAYVFHVETDGSFPVSELVLRAADELGSRADELHEAVTV